jgi:hypothetical protein
LKKLGQSDYHRLIVGELCEFQAGLYGEKLNEAVEVFKEFPDKDFWDWMVLNHEFKVASPSWFLTNEGKIFLKRKERLMKNDISNKNKNYKIEKCSVGEDLKINKKKKNILDFIRNG